MEVSVVELSALIIGNPAWRLDAEFFGKPALNAMSRVLASRHEILGNMSLRIQHPLEVQREYVEDGLPTVMAGNVRPNRADTTMLPMMDMALAETLERNLLVDGDILLVRTGANYGTVAPWKHKSVAYACADLLVVRAPAAPAGFVSSFLTGKFGKPLVDRCSYGSAQPHISPSYIGLIPIPRFGELEAATDILVGLAVNLESQAQSALAEAETLLLDALGLCDWSPPEPLNYTRSAADVTASGRFDAEFAAPKVQALLKRLSAGGSTLADVADVRRAKFKPAQTGTFNYIEIGDLDGFGRAVATEVPMADAPSRATWHVCEGDVITSTVRPIRRLSAIISDAQDMDVCSSGFVVLQPRGMTPECLLTYLRLPLVCGLMHLFATASMYPALSETDLVALPVPAIDVDAMKAVTLSVTKARTLLAKSEQLLETAKRAVEIAIEDTEAAALTFIAQQVEAADAAAI